MRIRELLDKDGLVLQTGFRTPKEHVKVDTKRPPIRIYRSISQSESGDYPTEPEETDQYTDVYGQPA